MTFLYILLALVVLLVMITVHEFGHYCAGKIFGFKINEFAIGFGPKIYSKKKKDGEIFSIRALPLGGFCAFEGEDEDGNETPGSMNSQPAWKRLIVLLSGVAFNFLFGVLTAVFYLLSNGFATAQVTGVVHQEAILSSNLKTNDIIVSVNGKTVEAYRHFEKMIAKFKAGEKFTVTVNRDGKLVDVETSKEKYNAFYYIYNSSKFENKLFDIDGNAISIEEFTNKIMSISTSGESAENVGKGFALKEYLSTVYNSSDVESRKSYGNDEALFVSLFNKDDLAIQYVKSGVSMGISFKNHFEKYNFFESVSKALPFCFYLCGLIFESLAGIFTGAVHISQMGGTVTAISQIAEISQMGFDYFLLLLPFLAMNLAVFNILPIPALDGARALFVLIEMIFRKPINRKVEGWIHTIGLFVLLGLVLFLDVYHFFFASYFLRL